MSICINSYAKTFFLRPYIQNPNENSISIVWLTDHVEDFTISIQSKGEIKKTYKVGATKAESLFLENKKNNPYKYEIRISDLKPNINYSYTVLSSQLTYSSSFKLVNKLTKKIKFAVIADIEAEKKSIGSFVNWENKKNKKRKYIVDQHQGTQNNIDAIKRSNPDFILIAGDLVEVGGKQSDWNMFWDYMSVLSHNTYIFPSTGNHEYYAGKNLKHGYSQPYSENAIQKYLSYFSVPDNGGKECFRGRYYAIDYGVVKIISLDTSNAGIKSSHYDTNHFLKGEKDTEGGCSPTLSPNSPQYRWLVKELKIAAQKKSFVFIIFHHPPYGSGVHNAKNDKQSGEGLRFLTKVFKKYKVDAVFSGHNEMYERSLVDGIHFYTIGIGGDGLRKPISGVSNQYEAFSVEKNAPEVWKNNQIIKGGRHYGHLLIEVIKQEKNLKATIKPNYVIPQSDGKYNLRSYDDLITITK
jgi:3',5'-cyclic AMP phosphodiesterase CpdA